MNGKQFFTGEDLKEAYLNGWDEALKTQWIIVVKERPKENEKVFVCLNITEW